MNKIDPGKIARLLFLAAAVGISLYGMSMVLPGTGVWIAVLIIMFVLSVAVGWPLVPTELRGALGAGMPPESNPSLAAAISQAEARLKEAKARFEEAQTALDSAENAVETAEAAVPRNDEGVQAKQEAARLARLVFNEAQATYAIEQSQLDHLLQRGMPSGILGHSSVGTGLQYLMFGSLAAFVLYHLMQGITSSPPPGTTPRGMITLLISVVTVGIALILVLSTIVSQNFEEKRFSQGKEILTALLGVLGTIVGFYFGNTPDDSVSRLTSAVPVLRKIDAQNTTLSTRIEGGKSPYYYVAIFTPASISTAHGKSDDAGRIEINVGALDPNESIGVALNITDSAGRSSQYKYEAVTLPPTPPSSSDPPKE